MIMRKRTREIAMELLYQSTMNEKTAEELMDDYFEDNQDDLREDTDLKYLEDVLSGVMSHKENIDKLIEKYLVNWKLSRVSKINLSILRLATYEILYVDNIPDNVSIYEAVEMAKKYSDESSGSFVNGVLDKISHTDHDLSAAPLTVNAESEADAVPETGVIESEMKEEPETEERGTEE
ncbi:transcription antitermination factor NusB [Proteiniclasticum sp.]|uniref:transcription antitermination factor NusB n=1 Tax=Proteiniclasticum sp. TaxID=2053595 RepID=UPI002898D65D|nr:transcription antitermination factor NusB [Proteiniclasticum sp.]